MKNEAHINKAALIIFVSGLLLWLTGAAICAQDSSEYVKKSWALNGEGKFAEVYNITAECIEKFGTDAEKQSAELTDFPPKGDETVYQLVNDVATCYFIRGESFRSENKKQESIKAFQTIVTKFPFAEAFDPRGWYWSLKEKAEKAIAQLEGKDTNDGDDIYAPEQETKVTIYDEGQEFPVNYAEYGDFTGTGTDKYQYIAKDPVALAKAVGEGIYPNSSSLKFDPEFIAIKSKLGGIKHWDILNTRNLKTAFYKWCMAAEPPGVKQFYIADILERSGLIKHAIKSYYAILIHFPQTSAWTYWNTPWYPAKAAIYRIQHLLRENPQLGYKLKDASVQIINGTDNDVRNDSFIVNPGKLVKSTVWENIGGKNKYNLGPIREINKVVEKRGGDKVQLVKYDTGDWQMLVDKKPFIIKGITYAATRVGESPDNGTLQNWTTQDTNNNGIIDGPFEAWVDENHNNVADENEKPVGDFALMKDMGVNCIRLYHNSLKTPLNKTLLRQLYERYGIYVAMGDFLGKYAIGSGAAWDPGTDYDNPEHKQNMLASVKAMVNEFKDEPYILIWVIGNENVYGVACNADKKPESFFKFANEAALLIKSLDPLKRPVAIASGDILYLNLFGKHCPDIDIFGANAYRGKYGFMDFWDETKRFADKPAMITEYGASSYSNGYSREEAEDFQTQYHKFSWLDILRNSCGYTCGNAIGGFAFEWLDEWWKAYEPAYHDVKGLWTGPFLDGYMHEEWLGITGQGNGRNSPFLRQLKKTYFVYKELWN